MTAEAAFRAARIRRKAAGNGIRRLEQVGGSHRRGALVHVDEFRHHEARSAQHLFQHTPAYPALGTKPVNDTYWTGMVLDRHVTFVANSIDEIAQVFDNYELIRLLGCISAINVPVVVGGEVIGTHNCMHEVGNYTPERVRVADRLKLPGSRLFSRSNDFCQGSLNHV